LLLLCKSTVSPHEDSRYRRWVLANVLVGQFIAAVDTRAIIISLPTLTIEFQTDVQTLKWTFLAYHLSLVALVLILGRIGDLVGRKKTYALGFAVFTVASLLCGLAASVAQLILFRIIQGVGAAMLIANGRAIISSVFPAAERGKALGLTSTGFHLGFLTGPSVGGFLIDSFGWRWIFFLNVPIGILGTLLAWKILKESVAQTSALKLDLKGVALLVVILLSLFLGLHWVTELGVEHFRTWSLFLIFVLGLLLLLRVETQNDQPILDLSLFRNRLYTAGNLSLFFVGLGMGALSLFFPFYLQGIRGFSASEMGLILMADSVVIVFASPIGGWLSDRLGSRLLCTTGATLMALAYVAIGMLQSDSPTYQIVLAHALSGLAWAMFNSPNVSAVFSSAGPEKFGQAAGMLMTMFGVGQSVGVVVATLILGLWINRSGMSSTAADGLQAWRSAPGLYLWAFRTVCAFAVAAELGAVVSSAVRPPKQMAVKPEAPQTN